MFVDDLRADTITVSIGGEGIEIQRSVFVELLDNSSVTGRVKYARALQTSEIQYSVLVELARKAEVPHPLFFAPLEFVRGQVRAKTDKLLQGVAPDNFTVNTRTTIKLRDVELIIKDLLRKQALIREHDSTLQKNRVIGILRHPRSSVRLDAQALVAAIGLDTPALRAMRNKGQALEMLIERLEASQVLVSRSVQGFMPQRLQGVHFSGLTVRDSKVPYIFLAGGDHGDYQEPAGRQIFTLTLMAVMVARGIFQPVTYDASSTAPNPGREYDIVGEILMPEDEVQTVPLRTIDDIHSAADTFKVTPSAMTVRALRLNALMPDTAAAFIRELEAEFRARPKPKPRQPKPVNAVRKYSGRMLTSRMLRAVDERKLSEREFCRVVCLNRLTPRDLGELRASL